MNFEVLIRNYCIVFLRVRTSRYPSTRDGGLPIAASFSLSSISICRLRFFQESVNQGPQGMERESQGAAYNSYSNSNSNTNINVAIIRECPNYDPEAGVETTLSTRPWVRKWLPRAHTARAYIVLVLTLGLLAGTLYILFAKNPL